MRAVSTALLLFGAASLAAQVPRQDAAEARPALELELSTPAPVDPGMPARLDGLNKLSCTFCHETIADEWAQSLHALAWVDPRYQAQLADRRRPASCHGCHIPEPLHGTPGRFGAKPAPRTEEMQKLHFGVSCQSCHVGPQGVVLGPWGHPTDAHESERSPHFIGQGSNALCSACHRTTVGPVIGVAKDFLAARLEEQGMSCVGCHMAPVERSAATDDDDNPTPVRPGRSHLLQTPRDPGFLRKTFTLAAARAAGGVTVTVTSRAGHRIPGLVGRRIVWTVDLIGPDGRIVSTAGHEVNERAPLATLATIELPLADEQRAGTAVRIRAEHFPPEAIEAIPFLDERIQLGR